jgi:hypothetical protein
MLWVMKRYTSGGMPSIPRTWGRLTPGAPCPLSYRKRVAVSEALASNTSATHPRLVPPGVLVPLVPPSAVAAAAATQTQDSDTHGERDRGLLGPQRLLAACSVSTRYHASCTVAATPYAPHGAVVEALAWWLWRIMVGPQTMRAVLAQRERTPAGAGCPTLAHTRHDVGYMLAP